MPRIGVLAIQGDFQEHRQTLERIGVETAEVRLARHLDSIDGLIIPGGESTTIVQLMDIYDLREPVSDRVRGGFPIWGTCAGMIVLANRLAGHRPDPLKLMDIEVRRNAFGRQVDSFEVDLDIKGVSGPPFHAIFIRAPIVAHTGSDVEVLATLDDGRPVAVRQSRILATAFHPELTEDPRVHELFVRMVEEKT